jgi:hypothetical protein
VTGKPQGKRPLAIFRCKWKGNIKMDSTEIEWEGVELINLAVDGDQW